MSFKCAACQARGKTWQGSNPKCGFRADGSFTPDNWNCATLLALRDVPVIVGHVYRDEHVGVIHVEEGSIVHCWYKSRGATHVAFLVTADADSRALQLSDAEEALGVVP